MSIHPVTMIHHIKNSFIIHLTTVYVTNKDRKIERKAKGNNNIYYAEKKQKSVF